MIVKAKAKLLQEAGSTTMQTVACMMCADIVLREGEQTILAAYRKVCSYMSKKLGLSPKDLPALLKTKLDDLCAKSLTLAGMFLN